MLIKNIYEQVRLMLNTLFRTKAEGEYIEQRAINKFGTNYRDIDDVNFHAIFADRITAFALADAQVDVIGDNARAQEINRILQTERRHEEKWMHQALGIGAVLLVPYTVNGEIHIDIVPQDRVLISEHSGCNIRRLSFLADVITRDTAQFARWCEYSLEDGVCIVRNKATHNGSEIALSSVNAWRGIEPEIRIGGCDRLLLGYFRCPTDNKSPDILTGVPLTFGCQSTIDEIKECMQQIRTEFEAKEAWVGISKLVAPAEETVAKRRHFVKLNSAGKIGDSSGSLFETFSPEIRESAYTARLLSLFRRLEKQVGTSSGILTPSDAVSLPTATQVRRASYDTDKLVANCRSAYAYAMDDVVYAINALLDYQGAPGNGLPYATSYKWGEGIAIDPEGRFNELCRGKQEGVVSVEEIRRYLYPDETAEEAQEAVKRISEANPINTMFEV